MSILEQTPNAFGFLLSEGPGDISRETVTLAAGPALLPGQLLGVVTDTNHYQAYDPAAADGSQIALAVLAYAQPARTETQSVVIIARQAELAADKLIGLDAAARADIAQRFLIVR